MTAVREIAALDAVATRAAVPVRSTAGVRLSDHARLVVVYQWAGNPYSVIGIAYGRPGHAPEHVIPCADPLNRAGVAAELEPVRDSMLAWFDSYQVRAANGGPGYPSFEADDLPQLIVAGAGMVKTLDDLSYMWRYTSGLDPDWQRLGWELVALTEMRFWPATPAVVPLAETLAAHFEFGISTLESAKLSVATALCDAIGNGGLSPAVYIAAERFEAGPLGQPDELDNPTWAAVRDGRRPPAVVAGTLTACWDLCGRALGHLRALPTSQAAQIEARKLAGTWAYRVGPDRTGVGFARRRALPALASAAGTLERLEEAQDRFNSAWALEDPMLAAELAGEGKGALVDARVEITPIPRTNIVTFHCRAAQPIAPPLGALVGFVGTKVTAVVDAVAGRPGAWDIDLVVAGSRGCNGVKTAVNMTDGRYWVVVVPKGGPPSLPQPPTAPATHPGALGRATAAPAGRANP